MSRSLVGSSHLGEKESHGDALLWPKNAGKKRKIGGHDGKLLENCGKNWKQRKNNGNCCKIREKRKTNKQSLNTIKVPDQTGKTNWVRFTEWPHVCCLCANEWGENQNCECPPAIDMRGEHAEPVEKMPRQETEMPTVQSWLRCIHLPLLRLFRQETWAWSGEGTEQRVATWKVHCTVWCCRIARSTANTKHLCVTFSYLAEALKPDHNTDRTQFSPLS